MSTLGAQVGVELFSTVPGNFIAGDTGATVWAAAVTPNGAS